MTDPRSVDALKSALQRLPGVGPKSAQRMAFHLLERDREGARQIGEALRQALARVNHCRRCNNFSESELCEICASAKRDAARLCVLETPADLEAIEQAGVYQGMYFVLMGHLSPLDGRVPGPGASVERPGRKSSAILVFSRPDGQAFLLPGRR